jgi:methyl-accepting chemotaxis protein
MPLLLLALVSGASGIFISNSLLKIERSYSLLLDRDARAATASVQFNVLVLDLARAAWRGLAVPEAKELSGAVAAIEGMAASAERLKAQIYQAVSGTPVQTTFESLDRDFAALRAVGLRGLRALQESRGDEGRRVIREEFAEQIVALRAVSRQLTERLLETANAQSDELTAEANITSQHAFMILGVGLVLSLSIGIAVSRFMVVRPIMQLNSAMQALAGGDLSVRAGDTNRTDEIGTMSNALQSFADSLRAAEDLRVQQQAERLRNEQERKATLLSLAGTLEETVGSVVGGIAAASGQLSAAASSMVNAAAATTSRAATVSRSSDEASSNVNTVAAATEELSSSVAEISRRVSESARMAAASVQQADRTNQTVGNLQQAATQIGEVTRLIGNIAGQTNLLALNATIEAARAGEAGKGFAVVASEVKTLATQTAQATQNITQQVQAIQAATQEAANEINAIRDSIGQISDVTAAIAAAVEEQGAATRDIAQNVQHAANGTSDINNAINDVTEAAATTSGAASQVQATSSTLAEQAATLRSEVQSFLDRVRAA